MNRERVRARVECDARKLTTASSSPVIRKLLPPHLPSIPGFQVLRGGGSNAARTSSKVQKKAFADVQKGRCLDLLLHTENIVAAWAAAGGMKSAVRRDAGIGLLINRLRSLGESEVLLAEAFIGRRRLSASGRNRRVAASNCSRHIAQPVVIGCLSAVAAPARIAICH